MGNTPSRTLGAVLGATALVATALLLSPAASAADKCNGKNVTKTISSGSFTGTAAADVVQVRGNVNLYLEGGNDSVCVVGNFSTYVNLGDGDDYFSAVDTTGDHTVRGGAGDDYIDGSDGTNEFIGEAGSDELYGGSGDDHLSAGEGDDFIHAGGGNDNVVASSGNDTVRGSSGDDTLSGGSGNDTISGGDDDDTIIGDAGDDNISGDADHDTIGGGAGADEIRGNAGNDTISGDTGSDVVYGDAGNDTIYGDLTSAERDDTLTGSKTYGDDSLYGEDGNDTIYGGYGDDKIRGNDGNDRLYGDWTRNEGEDIRDLVGSGSGAIATVAFAALSIHYGDDKVYGGDGNDKLGGDRGDDLLDGGRGDDYLEGGPGSDTLNTGVDVKATASAWEQVDGDTLIGDYYETRVSGGMDFDNDVLTSTATTDLDLDNRPGVVKGAYGGAGDDAIAVWGLNTMKIENAALAIKAIDTTWINGGPGDDKIVGQYLDHIDAESGDDEVKAFKVAYIHGDGGNDIIEPKGGITKTHGDDGDDLFWFCGVPEAELGKVYGGNDRDNAYSDAAYISWGGLSLFGPNRIYIEMRSDLEHFFPGKESNPTVVAPNRAAEELRRCDDDGTPPKIKPVNVYLKEFDDWTKNHKPGDLWRNMPGITY